MKPCLYEQQLLQSQENGEYLLRFSRMQPDVLTITLKTPQGEIRHTRNSSTGEGPVPIADFLKEKSLKHNCQYQPVQLRLNKQRLGEISFMDHVYKKNDRYLGPG